MLLRIYEDKPSPRHLKTVNECLMDGGVIIYPTDTVYAFGCHVFKPKAIERISQLKGIKKKEANFSFIFSDIAQISDYTKNFDKVVFKLMKRHFPGPFTFILDANNSVPKIFNNKKKSIGVRIPDHAVAREIINYLAHPLISSSIHDHDEILAYNTDAEILHEEFEDQVDIVIDGGYGDNQVSTIVNCLNGEIEITRQGKGILEF
ncbi:MAG: threonylcarbamoyl-AMP synthase [Bacteroidetes bacterium 4572_77]|nr:MAG: threonylcarbamoyl-AMP synthase [Bacteroidetes bacterium 4572_77]